MSEVVEIPPRPRVGLREWQRMTEEERVEYRRMQDRWDEEYGGSCG